MTEQLSPSELEALHALTLGSVRHRIDSAHAAKLVELGYARETADGVLITSRGRAHLAALRQPLAQVLMRRRRA